MRVVFFKKTFFGLLLLSFCFQSLAQQSITGSIDWKEPIPYGVQPDQTLNALFFEKAQYDFSQSANPFLYIQIPSAKNQTINQVNLVNAKYAELTDSEKNLLKLEDIANSVSIEVHNSVVRKKRVAYLKIIPFRKNGNLVERLVDYEIQYTSSLAPLRRQKSRVFASNSILSNGDWYKIAVTKSGVVKLNYSFIKNMGIEPSSIDPRNFRIFGSGGGQQPLGNDEPRPDDLVENAIQVLGESDGVFNSGDYILFYAKDQVTWEYDTSRNMFRHYLNKYSDTSYYFLTTNLGAGKRIQKVSNPAVSAVNTTRFDDYAYYEQDLVNLIKSGQEWYGELFENTLSYNFSFEFPGIDVAAPATLAVNAAARSAVVSNFLISAGDDNFNMPMGSTVLTRYEVGFARPSTGVWQFNPSSALVNLQIAYNKPQSSSKGWLNYIDINVRRFLIFNGGQMHFRDRSLLGQSFVNYQVSANAPMRIWDITNTTDVEEKTLSYSGSVASFIEEGMTLHEFIVFSSGDSSNVFFRGMVPNQNLHGMAQADMIIVSHQDFMSAALKIKQLHENEGLTVNLVNPTQIYNEFSSGAQDPVAIRSFMKMFYDRANNDSEMPKYLLIIGDGSYDFKNRINGNTNFVISYQSRNSLDPVNSYVSDDFLVLLDDNEGEWAFSATNPDKMDVSVGRLPVKTLEEANGIYNKLKAYYNLNNRGDWQNKIVFVGDDGDGVTHMAQANQLATLVQQNAKVNNLSKIYLDAFQRESTASGPRFPAANESIRRAVDDGALVVNYTGHGGETGWAHERVLDIATITNWKNIKNLPLFMTATCEFSRFDDPLRTSGGELVLLNPNGGGIALMTTTRLVYSTPNYYLNQSFYNKIFERLPNGDTKRLGDVLLEVKNANASQGNTRNFSLLGDPALEIAIPHYNVQTLAINGQPINTIDTIKALSKVTISGQVVDQNGQILSNFNGLVYPTVYDKESEKSTLNNTGGGTFRYNVQESKVFKGKATVQNGQFTFEFIVPKDIAYNYGKGKISYFISGDLDDGNGFSEDFIIGGSDPNAIADEKGPEIELYLNDPSFVYGGITDENPTLIANLTDEQGINTVGNGIGHDLVAIIDQNTDKSIILNDYYEAETDSYQKGAITYPLSELSEGKHTLTLKAWDNANNSSEKTIEFTVVGSKEIQIQNLVNYPNPFTTNTEFIFQHNQPGIPLDVKLEIFTVSGKLVKSFDRVIVNQGFLSRNIRWDGRDDFGDRIGKGVYVYKLKVRSRNGSVTEKYEKLVIL